MSEKQFDIFDDSFREAARQYEPEFNEAAWKKMEAKLDGEPNNRKPFAWLWLFSDIIMIALVIIVLFQLNPGQTNTDQTNKNTPSIVIPPGKEDVPEQVNKNEVQGIETQQPGTTNPKPLTDGNERTLTQTLQRNIPSAQDYPAAGVISSSTNNVRK